MNRGSSARFAMNTGGTVTLHLGVVRHLDDDRRFLVANRGRSGVVLGEMYPFAAPARTDWSDITTGTRCHSRDNQLLRFSTNWPGLSIARSRWCPTRRSFTE